MAKWENIAGYAFVLLLAWAALLPAGAPIAAAADEPLRLQTDRLIVKLKNRSVEQRFAPIDQSLLERLSAHIERPLVLVRVMSDGSQLLRFDARMSVADAEALALRLAMHPDVDSVSVDRIALPQSR